VCFDGSARLQGRNTLEHKQLFLLDFHLNLLVSVGRRTCSERTRPSWALLLVPWLYDLCCLDKENTSDFLLLLF
jgi:hypothetical protein